MADLLGASIPERGAASTLQELLLRSQPLPRSPLRQYSSSSCSEAAAMAAADSLLTPLESCKNGVHSSWHQVVRQRQVSSGQHGHHRLWCGQPPSGAASAASRRPLPRGKRYVFGGSRQRRNQQGDTTTTTTSELYFLCLLIRSLLCSRGPRAPRTVQQCRLYQKSLSLGPYSSGVSHVRQCVVV